MRLNSVFIRFYKSFNIDYIRQHQSNESNIEKKPWEIITSNNREMWYPYIKVPIDPKITAVVGANESGKSHLLSAIEKAIKGSDYRNQPIQSRDFCRYSELFLVTSSQNQLPEFGTEWSQISEREQDEIRSLSDISQSRSFENVFIFRKSDNSVIIYLSEESNKYSLHPVKPEKIDELNEILPGTRRLKSNISLPSSIPIKKLLKKLNPDVDYTSYEMKEANVRKKIRQLIDKLDGNSEEDKFKNDLIKMASYDDSHLSENEREKQEEEIKLTLDLLCKIADVSKDKLFDLANSMEENDVGYTQAIVDKINRQLSANLNFPNYWVQDSKFRLLMSAKDHNLEFTIVDRTGTKYSFDERSSGLKYFLSYFIQHRAYEPPNEVPEILLMDEPDAFLSSQAQQDLLKIFEEVASSKNGTPASQVVYVTHSPFLINKNYSERIRVLDKGNDYEGTRVVQSVYQNHYEPLRSALGAFIAETVYIGHCNLMVEGPVDQVILAGASTYLRGFGIASKRESLDLNEITIVPAGGASNILYLTYLARGRDSEQPAVIVFLDSDEAGNRAKKDLTKSNKKSGSLKGISLKENFILQVKDLEKLGVQFPENLDFPEVEDLIPVSISVLAAQKYAKEICHVGERDIQDITEDFIQKKVENGETMFKAVEACVQNCSKDKPQIAKIGFSRNVIEIVNELKKKNNEQYNEAVAKFENNFKILFRELDKIKSLAEFERKKEKASQKVKSLAESFFYNHPSNVNREDVVEFLDKLEALLMSDDSFEAKHIKREIENIRNQYKLNKNLREKVENYEQFKRDVYSLKDAGKIASERNNMNEDIIIENNSSETSDTNNPAVDSSVLTEEVESIPDASQAESKETKSKTTRRKSSDG